MSTYSDLLSNLSIFRFWIVPNFQHVCGSSCIVTLTTMPEEPPDCVPTPQRAVGPAVGPTTPGPPHQTPRRSQVSCGDKEHCLVQISQPLLPDALFLPTLHPAPQPCRLPRTSSTRTSSSFPHGKLQGKGAKGTDQSRSTLRHKSYKPSIFLWLIIH